MTAERATPRTHRATVRALARALVLAAMIGLFPGTAAAAQGELLSYDFYDCTASTAPFHAEKRDSSDFGLRVTDGSAKVFVIFQGIALGDQSLGGQFIADGTVLYSNAAGAPQRLGKTITCTNVSGRSGLVARVTGMLVP